MSPFMSPLPGWDRGRSEAGLLQEKQRVEVTCRCQTQDGGEVLENQLEAELR